MKRIINILLHLLLVQTFTFAQGVGVDSVQMVNALADTCFNNTITDSVKLKSVPFETIAREGTKYYAVTSDGHKEEITSFINGQKRVIVKDGDGHELVIDKDGNVMGVEEYRASGGNEQLLKTFNAKKDSLMSTTDNITFEKVETENYGFDKWRGEEYDSDQYPTITDNNDYRPAYIGAEKEKTIRIKVNKTKGITFKSERGVPLIANEKDNTIAFNCGTTGRQAIYAYRDSTVVGKVNVQAYSYKDVKVHLVRVNGATKRLDVEAITKGVNEIFDDAVVRYTFDELDPITINYANKTHFVHGGKGTFQNYNEDQKTAIKALPETADPNDYYLFFVECYNRLDTAGNVSNDPVSGYMPVGRHYGFIYNEYTNARTIAHELGHGTNSLHHTFSPESETFYTTSKTDNLMDYNGGTTLTHTQWQWSHEKHRNVLGFLDDEGESEAIADAVNALSDYEYAYIKKCSDEQNNNETLSTKVERYKVIGKKLSGENTIETINLNYEESGLVTFIAEDFTDAILIFDNGNLVNACEPALPIDIDVCSISTIDDQSSLIEKIDAAVQNCLSSYLTGILQKLNAISSSNSIVEYTINNNSYRLVDGQIQKSPLSSDDLNNGNWEDGSIEQILRLEKNADGIIQVKAFGFHKDLKPQGYDWNGNSIKYFVDLSQLSSDIRATTNKYLKQNNVTTFDQKPNCVLDDVFPGNQTIVLDGNSSCVSLILKGLDISKEFLKTAEFEQKVYQTDLQSEIKLPAIVTGTTESIARSVTDITSLVSFGYDIIFDDEVRHQTIEGFGAIKDQVIEDPSMLFPLLRDVVIEEFTGATYDQYTELTADSTDSGRCNHLSSKIAVRSAASLFAGGKVVAKLPEMAFELARKISLTKGFKRFDLHEAQDIYKTFFDDFDLTDANIKKKFLDNPDYVDAWIFFKQYDVDASLRQNFGAMDAFLAKRAGKEIPAPETYLSKEFIARHLAKFEDGAAFIFTKQDVVSSRYKSFSPNKFVMPKSDIKKIVSKYKETGSIEFLEDALGYKRGALSGKDIYVLEIEKPKVKLPIGNEAGANEFWLPGGKNSGGYNEAVLDNIVITHNNDIENLKNSFQIKDYK